MNNSYLKSLPLADSSTLRGEDVLAPGFTLNERLVRIPPFLLLGQNQLQFQYDLKPHKQGDCQATLPEHITGSIDPDSTIDLSDTQHYAILPDLASFANTGFPFTRLADLGETTIVLVDQPTPLDIEAYLDLMGSFGESTGYPTLRSTVIGPDAAPSIGNRDAIVIGTLAKQPLLERWAAHSHLSVANGQLRVPLSSPSPDRALTARDWSEGSAERESANQVLVSVDEDFGALIGLQSPLAVGRSVVMIVGGKPENLVQMVNIFRSRDLNADIQGDLAILTKDRISSFRIGDAYASGSLPIGIRIRYALADLPLTSIVFALVGVALLSIALYSIVHRIAAARSKSTTA
jgi:cellulose synthase (UDP-forming)